MQAWNANQVNWHTTFSIDIDIQFFTARKIRRESRGEKSFEPLMRNIEELRGHVGRGEVISIA
jgi:hypothetical protein